MVICSFTNKGGVKSCTVTGAVPTAMSRADRSPALVELTVQLEVDNKCPEISVLCAGMWYPAQK